MKFAILMLQAPPLFLLLTLATGTTTTIHVAPPGTHQNHELGTITQPFLSLENARDHLRQGYGFNTERIVHIQSGKYYLNQTFQLNKNDSGTAEHPIRYRGATTNPPTTLSGGVEIPPSSFKRSTTMPNVWVANLFDHGLNASSLGSLANPYPKYKMELFYGDENHSEPMTLSRDPNIDLSGNSLLWKWVGYENMTVKNDTTTAFEFSDTTTGEKWRKSMMEDRARNETSSMWLHGYWKFDWRDTYVRVDSIVPSLQHPKTAFTVSRDPTTPPQYPWISGCRFYAVNSLGLLDQPGEYYISTSTGDVYFWPPSSTGGVDYPVVVSVLHQVISNDQTSNVAFENLIISTSQGTVIDVKNGADNVNVTGCTASNAGTACVSMSGVTNSHVTNSIVYGCGGTGISMTTGNIQTLASGKSSVVRNLISNFSRIHRTYQPGIGFNSVGLYVAHNNISDGPHACLQGGGNDNIFEHNHIEQCTYETVDVGAFYVGRSWSQRGNVARYNKFQNIRSHEKLAQASCSQNAFYLDDQMSGWEFYGNTIVNATTGVLIGGGRRNIISNNTFIDCDNDIHFDNRGMNWQANSCAIGCDPKLGTSCFHGELVALNYTQPPYSIHYPEIVNIYKDHPCVPIDNIISGNRFCHNHSKGGGKFIDRNVSTVKLWLSSMENNTELC